MLDSEKLGIAAHLHVLMRRRLERVTDVEWMVRNRDYALEVIRLCRASEHAELHPWADKLEGAFAAVEPPPAKPVDDKSAGQTGAGARYVGRLR